MNTTSNLNVNHYFPQLLVHTQISKFANIYTFVISNSKSFIRYILKVLGPLGKKLNFPVPWDLKYNKKPLGLCLLGDRYFCNVITLIIIMVWLSGRARFLGVDFLSGQKS